MGLFSKLFGKGDRHSAAGKSVYVFRVDSHGWGVVMKETWVEESYRKLLQEPATRKVSKEAGIAMLAAGAVGELRKQEVIDHGIKQDRDGGLVHHTPDGRDVVEPTLPDDWGVPCYWVMLFRGLQLKPVPLVEPEGSDARKKQIHDHIHATLSRVLSKGVRLDEKLAAACIAALVDAAPQIGLRRTERTPFVSAVIPTLRDLCTDYGEKWIAHIRDTLDSLLFKSLK